MRVCVGQDSNAPMGVAGCREEGEPMNNNLGRHGIDRIGTKGRNLLNFTCANNLVVLNTFLKLVLMQLIKALIKKDQ